MGMGLATPSRFSSTLVAEESLKRKVMLRSACNSCESNGGGAAGLEAGFCAGIAIACKRSIAASMCLSAVRGVYRMLRAVVSYE